MRRYTKRGSTLVEALVAVAIVAIGITGASRLLVSSIQLSDTARTRARALALARIRYEQMSMASFDDLVSWNVSNQVVNARGLPDDRGNYRMTTQVDYPQTNLASVVISVGMRDRTSRLFEQTPETINTYLSNPL